MRLLLSAKFLKHHGRGLRHLMHKTKHHAVQHLSRSMARLTHSRERSPSDETPKKIGGAVKRINPIKFKF